MSGPAISILIPTYNRSALLTECIQSVLNQDFTDYEVIVSDDCSPDDTQQIVTSMTDSRVHYFRNERNLGYGGNLAAGAAHATGGILFLLGHDDILLPGALAKTNAPFARDPAVGLVTRPYYWFYDRPTVPVRIIAPYDLTCDRVVTLADGYAALQALFRSAGQLSGLAFRRTAMRVGFHHHVFTSHIYPFSDVLKRSKAVYLKDYTVAVRIESSMTRHKPDIYRPSPTETWIQMFHSVYAEPEFADVLRSSVEFIASDNYVGLVQLRNFADTRVVMDEIRTLIRARPRNLLAPKFWLYSLLCLVTPAPVLIRLVDAYKRRILARMIPAVEVTKGFAA